MSGRASRRKGSSGELEVAKVFAAHGFSNVRRTPNSGGLSIKGDLIGLDGYSVEVKRQERLAVPAWLRQAHADASAGDTPLLIFRCNATSKLDPLGRWHVTLPLDDFAATLAELRLSRSVLRVAA